MSSCAKIDFGRTPGNVVALSVAPLLTEPAAGGAHRLDPRFVLGLRHERSRRFRRLRKLQRGPHHDGERPDVGAERPRPAAQGTGLRARSGLRRDCCCDLSWVSSPISASATSSSRSTTRNWTASPTARSPATTRDSHWSNSSHLTLLSAADSLSWVGCQPAGVLHNAGVLHKEIRTKSVLVLVSPPRKVYRNDITTNEHPSRRTASASCDAGDFRDRRIAR